MNGLLLAKERRRKARKSCAEVILLRSQFPGAGIRGAEAGNPLPSHPLRPLRPLHPLHPLHPFPCRTPGGARHRSGHHPWDSPRHPRGREGSSPEGCTGDTGTFFWRGGGQRRVVPPPPRRILSALPGRCTGCQLIEGPQPPRFSWPDFGRAGCSLGGFWRPLPESPAAASPGRAGTGSGAAAPRGCLVPSRPVSSRPVPLPRCGDGGARRRRGEGTY